MKRKKIEKIITMSVYIMIVGVLTSFLAFTVGAVLENEDVCEYSFVCLFVSIAVGNVLMVTDAMRIEKEVMHDRYDD